MTTLKVLGICGSRRAGSYNRMALSLAGELMPPHMSLTVADWSAVPPFDADVLAHGLPAEVRSVRELVRSADAVLIATPEYNFSVPGMLKNLLDWVSRGDDQPLADKPVAIISASAGPVGGARMQYDLRKILLFMNAQVLAKPEVFIGNAAAKFSAEGVCTDTPTRDFVGRQMQALGRYIVQVHAMRAAALP